MAIYTYDEVADTANGKVDFKSLLEEIEVAIPVALNSITINSDLIITFATALSAGEEAALTTVVNNHQGDDASVNADNSRDYKLHEIEESGSVTYIGLADNNGIWFFKKMTESGINLSITYANISNNATKTNFALAWTDRATLTYDTIDNLTGV